MTSPQYFVGSGLTSPPEQWYPHHHQTTASPPPPARDTQGPVYHVKKHRSAIVSRGLPSVLKPLAASSSSVEGGASSQLSSRRAKRACV